MTEPELFDWKPPLLKPRPKVAFDGPTYDTKRDHARLETLQERVHAFMSDGQWHTLEEIQQACGGRETSVSARIRDLRKEQRGGFKVQSEFVKRGLWRYRMVPVTEAGE